MRESAIEELNGALLEFAGGAGTIWNTMRCNAVLVVAVSSPHKPNMRALLECIGCTQVSYRPSWTSSEIRCKLLKRNGEEHIEICDGYNLKVECLTARLTVEEDGRDPAQYFTRYAKCISPLELIETLCNNRPKSFTAIHSYFDGYTAALQEHLIPWRNEGPSDAAFREWVKFRLGWAGTTADWKTAIESRFPDDRAAAECFCQLYAEFRAEYEAGRIEDPPPRGGYV